MFLAFLGSLTFAFGSLLGSETNSNITLYSQYSLHCNLPSDINEHLPALREIASECQTVIEIGVRNVVSSWGLIQGLSESPFSECSYLGIDLHYPEIPVYNLVKKLTEDNDIAFDFWTCNDLYIDLPKTDLLFLDTLHIYAHLTFELEKFSECALKYIIMHDTSQGFEYTDCGSYTGDYSEYPDSISRTKRGLWPAVEDFLKGHPEWTLYRRYTNNNGLTILKRV